MDQAPVGWIILDQLNTVSFLNLKAQRLLEIPTSYRFSLSLEDLNDHNVLMDLVDNVRDRSKPQRVEWDYGQQELEAFAFDGQQGSVAILLQSRRSLEAQLDQQERWVSDVAHELKTPLTALLLVGDSLAGKVTDQNAVLVERLLKELRRMQDLVGDLLELSRLENVLPGEGIQSEPVNLLALLKEVWNGIKPLADQKHLYLDINFERGEDAIEATVYADKRRLHRALLNLFDNAVHFSPCGSGIQVEMQATADWVRIGILDQGVGLSEEDMKHMFDRFYRGDSSRYRQHRGGSGLGLAIVQQIALAHGGWVFGENDSRGGARFELRLPVRSIL
ncbi:MAG: HAMP domain-containing sensor histidine kinase [Cyanobacteriota bacterium]|nr:HAMP domain-containing sensor histidine kinase [Cyanobacteriota bacterium]